MPLSHAFSALAGVHAFLCTQSGEHGIDVVVRVGEDEHDGPGPSAGYSALLSTPFNTNLEL